MRLSVPSKFLKVGSFRVYHPKVVNTSVDELHDSTNNGNQEQQYNYRVLIINVFALLTNYFVT